MTPIRNLLFILCVSLAPGIAAAQTHTPPDVAARRDIVYAEVNGTQLKLDLYLPDEAKEGKRVPLIVWIHGGGWMKSNKSNCFPRRVKFYERGYAIASVGYRLSDKAQFPAQLEDCKAAVRWLRANAAKYNIDPDRIGAWGSSAGAHLAMLLGLTNDIRKFDVGANLAVSSRVMAVGDFYGPTDLTGKQAPLGKIDPMIAKLLGGPIAEKMESAIAASPLTYVSKNSVPIFIIHGTADPTVDIAHAKVLKAALEKAGAPHKMTLVQDASHGGMRFYDSKLVDEVDAFFAAYLKPAPASAKPPPTGATTPFAPTATAAPSTCTSGNK